MCLMIFPRAEPQAAVRCPAVSNYPHFLDISGCSGTHHDQKLEQCRQQTWRPVLSDRYSDPEQQQRWSRHHKVIKIVCGGGGGGGGGVGPGARSHLTHITPGHGGTAAV